MKHFFLTLALLFSATFSFKTTESFSGEAKEPINPYEPYDMYAFALQWGRGYCYTGTNPSSCYIYLEQIPRNHMSIHGLWPGHSYGGQHIDCGGTDRVYDDGSEIFQFMYKYWPSLNGPSESFWTHEYDKHGYCYTIQYEEESFHAYFEKTRNVFLLNGYNTMMIDIFGEQFGEFSVTYSELVAGLNLYFGGKYYSLVCKNKGNKSYLTEIRVGLDLDFRPMRNPAQDSCGKKKPIIILYA